MLFPFDEDHLDRSKESELKSYRIIESGAKGSSDVFYFFLPKIVIQEINRLSIRENSQKGQAEDWTEPLLKEEKAFVNQRQSST